MWDDVSYCKLETTVYMRVRRVIKTHETLVRALGSNRRRVRTKNATRAMPITPGIHEPDKPYAVPDSEHAWGAKGDWHGKSALNCYLEDQYERTCTTEGYDGRIDHIGLANHEVRLRDEDSKFIPKAKNFAPRPTNWKPGKHKNCC